MGPEVSIVESTERPLCVGGVLLGLLLLPVKRGAGGAVAMVVTGAAVGVSALLVEASGVGLQCVADQ